MLLSVEWPGSVAFHIELTHPAASEHLVLQYCCYGSGRGCLLASTDVHSPVHIPGDVTGQVKVCFTDVFSTRRLCPIAFKLVRATSTLAGSVEATMIDIDMTAPVLGPLL